MKTRLKSNISRVTWEGVKNVLSQWSHWPRMNFKYSLYMLCLCQEMAFATETLSVWVLLFIPQNFIWKNNLQRQQLLMIPLSRRMREKLAHETLDNSPMRKNNDDYYEWLLKTYIPELNLTLLWVCWMWFPIVTQE